MLSLFNVVSADASLHGHNKLEDMQSSAQSIAFISRVKGYEA